MRAGAEILAWSLTLFGLTLVFISSVTPAETAVAAVAALGGAFAAHRVRHAAGVVVTGWRGAPQALLALPYGIVRGMAVLVTVMARRQEADTERQLQLRPGADAGWAATLLAVAPDTCVIDVAQEEVVVHRVGSWQSPVQATLTQEDRTE